MRVAHKLAVQWIKNVSLRVNGDTFLYTPIVLQHHIIKYEQ